MTSGVAKLLILLLLVGSGLFLCGASAVMIYKAVSYFQEGRSLSSAFVLGLGGVAGLCFSVGLLLLMRRDARGRG